MEHNLYCECYSGVLNVLKNDLCKLYNTVCTFEEEWKTRNKYSFGVKSSPSGQLSLYWSTMVCVNTMGWGRGNAKWNVSPPARDFQYSNGRWEAIQVTCPALDNWLMGGGVQLDSGQELANTVGTALGHCLHASWIQGGLQWIAVTHSVICWSLPNSFSPPTAAWAIIRCAVATRGGY